MTNNITLKIRTFFNMSLTEYTKSRGINNLALRNIVYSKSIKACVSKNSHAYKVKKALVDDGILEATELELEKRANKMKIKKLRKKIIAEIRMSLNMSIKEYFELNKEYFEMHDVKLSYLYVFLSGIGTGDRPHTKSWYIKKKLKEDGFSENL